MMPTARPWRPWLNMPLGAATRRPTTAGQNGDVVSVRCLFARESRTKKLRRSPPWPLVVFEFSGATGRAVPTLKFCLAGLPPLPTMSCFSNVNISCQSLFVLLGASVSEQVLCLGRVLRRRVALPLKGLERIRGTTTADYC